MKKIFFLISFLCLFTSLFSSTTDVTDFTIVNQAQVLEFFMEDDVLHARLTVTQNVKANSKTGTVYKKILYFDNDSKIEKVRFNNISAPTVISNDLPYDGIFHSDSKIAYAEYTLTGKKVDLEAEYIKVFTDYKFIEILRFRDSNYEVLNSTLEIKIPSWLNIDFREFNFDNSITKTKTKDGILFTTKNLKPKKDEKGIPDFRKCEPHLVPVVKSINKDNKSTRLMPETKDFYNWYAKLVSQIGNDNSGLITLTNGLIKDKADPMEKIKAINYYIQDNIKYIAFEHGIMGFRPESCQNVYNNKFGDCKGMANLAKEMLKIAGFDARLTWLGTTDVPYDYSLPSLYVDNHMICTVILDGNYLFVDPTEKLADINIYAERIQGKEVMIENGANYIIARIPVEDNAKNLYSTKMKLSLSNHSLTGEGNYTFKGNSKTMVANFLSTINKKDKLQFLSDFASYGEQNIVCKVVDEPVLLRDKEFDFNYTIKAENQIVEAGSELYINLEFHKVYEKLKIKDDRLCSFELSGKRYNEYTAEFQIPVGYKVSYLPENLLENNSFGLYEISYVQKDDKIIYHRKTYTNISEIAIDKIPEWNLLVDKLMASYENRIIIEKK